jgi:serine/threonine protein kinase/MFS family permease
MEDHNDTVCYVSDGKLQALIALVNSAFIGTILFRQLFLRYSDGSLLLSLYSIPLHLAAAALLGRAMVFGIFPNNGAEAFIGISATEGFVRMSVAAFIVQRSSGLLALRRACGLALALVLVQICLSYDKIHKDKHVPMGKSEFRVTNYYYLLLDSFNVSACLALGLYHIVQSRKPNAQPLFAVSFYVVFLNVCFLSWLVNEMRNVVFNDTSQFISCWELATSAVYFIFHPPALYFALRASSLQWRHIECIMLPADCPTATAIEQQHQQCNDMTKLQGSQSPAPTHQTKLPSARVIDFLALHFHECIGEGGSARVWRATLLDTWGMHSEGVGSIGADFHAQNPCATGAETGAARTHRQRWCSGCCSARDGGGKDRARTVWGEAEVAVKMFKTNSGCTELSVETARRQLAEVTIMSQVRHENVLRIYGLTFSPPAVGVVMELAERGALFDLITSDTQPDLAPDHAVGVAERLLEAQQVQYDPPVRFTGVQRLQLVLDAVCGLDRLHTHKPRPLLHRDIKSLNLMLDIGWKLKIADFGESSFLSHEKHQLANFTAHWTAPEVLAGGVCTPSADVYSLAMVVFEIYTGRQPFAEVVQRNQVSALVLAGNRPNLNQCVPAEDGAVIPAKLRELVLRSWDTELVERPPLVQWERVLREALALARGDGNRASENGAPLPSLWPTVCPSSRSPSSRSQRIPSVSVSRVARCTTTNSSLAAHALPSAPVFGAVLARTLVLLLTCNGGVAVYFQYSMLGATASCLNDNYEITAARIGLLASAYSVPNTMIPLLGGVLADRLAPLTAAAIFTGITALGATLFAVCMSLEESTLDNLSSSSNDGNTVRFYLLLLCQAIFGAGAESVGIMQKAVLASWFPSGRLAMAYSWILVFNNFGACLCLWVVPAIPKVQNAYVVSALIAIGSFGSILLLKLLVACGWLVAPVLEEDEDAYDLNDSEAGAHAMLAVEAQDMEKGTDENEGGKNVRKRAQWASEGVRGQRGARGQGKRMKVQRRQWASVQPNGTSLPLATLDEQPFRESLIADECSNQLLLALDLRSYHGRRNRTRSWGTEPVGRVSAAFDFRIHDTSPNKFLYDDYLGSGRQPQSVKTQEGSAKEQTHSSPASVEQFISSSLPLPFLSVKKASQSQQSQHELVSPVEQEAEEEEEEEEEEKEEEQEQEQKEQEQEQEEEIAQQTAQDDKHNSVHMAGGPSSCRHTAWFLLHAMMSPFALLVLMLGIGSTLNSTFENFGVSILQRQWGLAYSSANHYVSVLRIVAIVSMPLVGRVLDNTGNTAGTNSAAHACLMHKRFVCFGLVVMSSTYALLAHVGGNEDDGNANGRSPILALVPVFMLGVGSAVFFTAAWPSVGFLVNSQARASAFGVLTACQNVASLILSPLSGYVKDSTGNFQAMELMLAGLGLGAAAAGACLWRVRIEDGPADRATNERSKHVDESHAKELGASQSSEPLKKPLISRTRCRTE